MGKLLGFFCDRSKLASSVKHKKKSALYINKVNFNLVPRSVEERYGNISRPPVRVIGAVRVWACGPISAMILPHLKLLLFDLINRHCNKS
jgi:hypothetical protein